MPIRIIHTAAVAGAATDASMAQLPNSDSQALSVIEVAMVIALWSDIKKDRREVSHCRTHLLVEVFLTPK